MSEEEPLNRDIETRQPSNDNQNYGNPDEARAKKKKMIIIGSIAAAVIVILIIVLSVTLSGKDKPGPGPGPGPTPTPKPAFHGYNPYKNHANIVDNEDGFTGTISGKFEQESLALFQESTKGGLLREVDVANIPKGKNNGFVEKLDFEFYMTDYHTAVFELGPSEKDAFSIPDWVVPKPEKRTDLRMDMIGFTLNTDNDFWFEFADIANKDNKYITTQGQSLVWMDKYIQMDFKLPSQKVFGLGERVREFNLTEGAWTMWAIGHDSFYDNGEGGLQVYGVHPFMMVETATKGDFIGIFFRNSNMQSPILSFNDDGSSILSYITIGGRIEAYFFIHGSPEWITQQYHNVIGKPTLPPFWSLGFQQASWTYQTEDQVFEVVANYSKGGFPLEAIWLDIPYMSNYTDFTVNQTHWANIGTYADTLAKQNQHMVVILDAGISADDFEEEFYKKAIQTGALIQSTLPGDIEKDYNGYAVLKVWPDACVFPDWFNESSYDFWEYGLDKLYNDKIKFSGIWLDMNEPTGFCSGECPHYKVPEKPYPAPTCPIQEPKSFFLHQDESLGDMNYTWYCAFPGQDEESTYWVPFDPGYKHGFLDNMTLSLNATNYDSKAKKTYQQYDTHSLFALMQGNATYRFLTESSKYPNTDDRPFILSRSTFASQGRYTQHWLGDNYRKWDYMRYSIAGIMNMNMYGIPMVGADVCGFFGEKNSEMCGRWMQLSAFYPFARNHYNWTYEGNETQPSEPYTLDDGWNETAKHAIYQRYHFLRLQYTCLFEKSQSGGTCFAPLFFHYPQDEGTYDHYEETFMVAGRVKVTPVLGNSTNSLMSYFPKGDWVSLNNYTEIISQTEGGKVNLTTSKNYTLAHLAPGALIPYQANKDMKNSTYDLIHSEKISLIANLDHQNQSTGSVFIDEGISRSKIDKKQYSYFTFVLSANTMKKYYDTDLKGVQDDTIMNKYMEELIVVNANKKVGGVSKACWMDLDRNMHSLTVFQNKTDNSLRITPNKDDKLDLEMLDTLYLVDPNKDIDFCEDTFFQYEIDGGKVPELTGTNATFILKHKAGILPNLNATLSIEYTGIDNPHSAVRFHLTFADMKDAERKPFNPNVQQGQLLQDEGVFKLSDFVNIEASPFVFEVKSQGTDSVFYSTRGKKMAFTSNYVEWDATLSNEKDDWFTGIWGAGEHVSDQFFLDDGYYTMWNRDQPSPVDNGSSGKNEYGTHPFLMSHFMDSQNTRKFFGIWNQNAAGQDFIIKNNKTTGMVDVDNIMINGEIDLFIFQEENPNQLIFIKNYVSSQPMWASLWNFGWNQCRWGYHKTSQLEEVVANYDKNDIPLDVMWSDIDWMLNYRNFEYDPVRYKGLPTFVEALHQEGKRYVPILDAGTAYRPWGDYSGYTDGTNVDGKNIYIKGADGKEFVGGVWPVDTVFPDHMQAGGKKYWHSQLSKMHDLVKFDGLWLDMNEASSFQCTGACLQSQIPEYNMKYKLPYIPGKRDLEEKNIQLNAYHEVDGQKVHELDVHNMFAYYENYNTFDWFQKDQKKRAFQLSRSQFSGQYSTLWLGDNFSTEKMMTESVYGVMKMNMYGMPLTGADICGFLGNTNPLLCARWTAMGVWYPFTRNHNDYHSISQEPYVDMFQQEYEAGVTYTDIMREAIRTKYNFIRYYYTKFYMMAIPNFDDHTSNFYKPLFMEFPNDIKTYPTKDNKYKYDIMLGDALKLSVNVDDIERNKTTFYFPNGTWCDVMRGPCITSDDKTSEFEMDTKANEYYLHLREDYIVPLQDALSNHINSTTQLSTLPMILHANMKVNDTTKEGHAQGDLILDNGETTVFDFYYWTFNQIMNMTLGNYTLYFKLDAGGDKDIKCDKFGNAGMLGQIVQHNAKAQGLTTTDYDIVVTTHKFKQTFTTVAYDADKDTFTVDLMQNLQDLCQLRMIELIPKKTQEKIEFAEN